MQEDNHNDKCYWDHFVKRIFNNNNVKMKDIKNLERSILLQGKSKVDYMTKLDLIDKYPHLFTEKGTMMTAEEIE